MIEYNKLFYPILFSYVIGAFIITLSVMYIGKPRFFSRYKTWLLFTIGFSIAGTIAIPLQIRLVLHILFIGILTFVLIRLFYADSLVKCVWLTIYLLAISIAAEIICICFFWTFHNLEAYIDFAGNNLYMMLGITFTNMAILLLSATMPAMGWIIRSFRHTKEIFLYCLFPVYQFMLFCICMRLFKEPSIWMVCVGNVFLLLGVIVDIILLSSLDNLIKRKLHQEELELLALQQKNEYECYLKIQKQLEQHRLVKHEFANQLSTIYAMVYNQASVDDIDNMISSSNCFLNSEPTYMAFDECICGRRPKQSVREARHPE